MLKAIVTISFVIASWITGLLSIFTGVVIGLLIHVSNESYYWYSLTLLALIGGLVIIILSTRVYVKYLDEQDLRRLEAEIDLEISEMQIELKKKFLWSFIPFN